MPTSLKIIDGPQKGAEFNVSTGDTILGRGAKAQVKLTSPEVSWEHAIITRAGEDWMIENLSAHGTWLNDQKISGRTRLKPRDRIRVTDDTLLRFDTTEGPQVSALANPWVLRVVIGAVALLIILWIAAAAFRKPPARENWPYAFDSLSAWLQTETAAGRMDANALPLLRSARQQELAAQTGADNTDKTAQAFKVAATRYEKLLILIDGLEDSYHCMASAAAKPGVLASKLLFSSQANNMDTDDYAAAFKEFVQTKLEYCNIRAGLLK